MKRISLLLALAVLTGAMWGCGSNDSSSESAAASTAAATTAATTEGTTASKPRAEGMNYYDTKDGMFTFALSSDYKDYKNEMMDDCEYSFTPDGMAAIGFMSLIDYHYSAKGFTEGMVDDFKEKFDDVDWEETTVNGLPAVRLTAKKNMDGTENTFEYYMVQYGNGDLFMVLMGTPVVSSYKIDIEEIFSNVEYKGEPLKTGDELCDCGSFELTVPEKLYATEKSDGKVKIVNNLANSMNEYMCRLAVIEETDDSAESAFNDYYTKRSGNNKTVSIEKGETEIAGHKAYRIFWKINASSFSLTTDTYIFDENGKVYSITITAENSEFDKFSAECQPVIDSLSFK